MDVKPKGLIKRVLDFAVAELERRSRPPDRPASDYPEHEGRQASLSESSQPITAPEEASPARSVRPAAGGLHLSRSERGALKVRWSVSSDELSRSATLVEDGAVLCLRLVSFAAGRDHVAREVQDRPSVASQGECEIARPDGRAVVALGLRTGNRFVSIAHHIV